MGVVIREGAQPVEFLLAGGVPKGKLDVDIVDEDVVDVVFKDGRLVYSREIAANAQGASDTRFWLLVNQDQPSSKYIEQRSLAASTIASVKMLS